MSKIVDLEAEIILLKRNLHEKEQLLTELYRSCKHTKHTMRAIHLFCLDCGSFLINGKWVK